MFQVGSTITVSGSPERRKPNQCYLGTILFADGSSMDRYGQRQLAVAQKPAGCGKARRCALPTAIRISPATGRPNNA